MPIRPATPPDGWLDAVRGVGENSEPIAVGSLALKQTVSTPIPRLVLSPDDVPTNLEARFQTWDAFVIEGDGVALLSVKTGSEHLAEGEVLRGAFSERCLEAVSLAARELADEVAAFTPAFIECAPAGLFSLILRSPDAPPRYVKIVDGSLLRHNALELRSDLPALVERMRAASTSRQIFGSPRSAKGAGMKDPRVLCGAVVALVLLGLYALR